MHEEASFRLEVCEGWQKRAADMLHSHPRLAAQDHLRSKLDEWDLQTLPGHRLAKASKALKILSTSCQPRVFAAYIRMLCNGWCTKRRFRTGGCCRLGCGAPEDSIEHMARCPVVTALFQQHLRLPPPTGAGHLDAFFCMEPARDVVRGARADGLEGCVRQRGLGIYVVYRLHNALRTGALQLDDLSGAFQGFVREGRLGSGANP